MAEAQSQDLKETPLAGLHRELGARMVPFAGYAMPVQYADGIIAEHQHVRSKAGLFDVSHMGQARLAGPDYETVARALEALTPGDFLALKPGRMRYTLLLNKTGGILDDLMVSRPSAEDGVLDLVVNAACKAADFAHIENNLPEGVSLNTFPGRALLALQGPVAASVLDRHVGGLGEPAFMSVWHAEIEGVSCVISRSGYTGEDGFEISMDSAGAETVARALLGDDVVAPIGLGARDSLRLEAGLCLYGHDIDETTTPVEADLGFAIGKRRRADGGFPGAETIAGQLAEGAKRKRVGLLLDGRAPAREGAPIVTSGGARIGVVTSGGFGPTVGGAIAMGYVEPECAAVGTRLAITVRGRELPAAVVALPFAPHRYYRKPKS